MDKKINPGASSIPMCFLHLAVGIWPGDQNSRWRAHGSQLKRREVERKSSHQNRIEKYSPKGKLLWKADRVINHSTKPLDKGKIERTAFIFILYHFSNPAVLVHNSKEEIDAFKGGQK